MRKIIVLYIVVLFSIGCATTRTVSTDPCIAVPLPSGYNMSEGIETAEATLRECPNKLDEVFQALIGIAKSNPDKKNGKEIGAMFGKLTKDNVISTVEADRLFKRFFKTEFTDLPDIMVRQLNQREFDSIKQASSRELLDKRTGMVLCCGDKQRYEKAVAERQRVLNFYDNLSFINSGSVGSR